jgi:hypothetical protein
MSVSVCAITQSLRLRLFCDRSVFPDNDLGDFCSVFCELERQVAIQVKKVLSDSGCFTNLSLPTIRVSRLLSRMTVTLPVLGASYLPEYCSSTSAEPSLSLKVRDCLVS